MGRPILRQLSGLSPSAVDRPPTHLVIRFIGFSHPTSSASHPRASAAPASARHPGTVRQPLPCPPCWADGTTDGMFRTISQSGGNPCHPSVFPLSSAPQESSHRPPR